MYSKIAFRNVKRQLGNYIIYFITITLTVSMMFSMYNFLLSKQMIDYANNIRDLQIGWIGITIMLAILISVILGYATSHMLKLRKKEFGTYLTLGMTRKNVLCIFVIETFFICMLALIVGIAVGLFLFQGVISVAANIMEIDITFAKYSLSGFILTIVVVGVMFMLSALSSMIYLKKVSIFDLLHKNQKVKKGTRHPLIWLGITIGSLAVTILSVYNVYADISKRLKTGDENDYLLLFLLLLIISFIVLHVGLAKSIVSLMLKNKNFKSKGTRTFVLRQLSSELNSNAVLCGFMALLIGGAIVCTNICFAQKSSLEKSLDNSNPFDILANKTMQKDSPLSYDDAINKIEMYNEITDRFTYNIYDSGKNELYAHTPWTGEGFDGITDYYIKQSDYNKIAGYLGQDTLSLKDEYYILATMSGVNDCDFSNISISANNKKYSFKDINVGFPVISDGYMLIVVPDEAVNQMKLATSYEAMSLKDKKYDAQSLYKELAYNQDSGMGYDIQMCNFNMRELNRINSNSMVAVVMVGELFAAMMLVFLTLAILILKLLAGISEDRKKYRMLYCIGVNEEQQKKVLFWQLFFFFFLPYLIPILTSIPMAYGIGEVVKNFGTKALSVEIYMNAVGIGVFLTVIYMIYFIATYIVQKRKVIY